MSEKKDPGIQIVSDNRRATHEYFIDQRIEAGIELKGSEVKSCRDGKVQLVDSYASIERGELYLYKVNIGEWKQGGPYYNHITTRRRKLLLHKREILKLRLDLEKAGYTLIPLKFYLKKGRIKVELGLARGKNKSDKRQSLKEKDVTKNLAQARRRSSSSSSYDED